MPSCLTNRGSSLPLPVKTRFTPLHFGGSPGTEPVIPEAVKEKVSAVQWINTYQPYEGIFRWLKNRLFFPRIQQGHSNAIALTLSDGSILATAHPLENRQGQHFFGRLSLHKRVIDPGLPVRITALDTSRDLALLAPTSELALPASIPLATQEPETGDTVYLVGHHPITGKAETGYLHTIPLTLRETKVSRAERPGATYYHAVSDWLKRQSIKTEIKGLSGSAVLNAQGELVGIVGYAVYSQQQELGIIDLASIRKFLSLRLDEVI